MDNITTERKNSKNIIVRILLFILFLTLNIIKAPFEMIIKICEFTKDGLEKNNTAIALVILGIIYFCIARPTQSYLILFLIFCMLIFIQVIKKTIQNFNKIK